MGAKSVSHHGCCGAFLDLRDRSKGEWRILCNEKFHSCVLHQILLEWSNCGRERQCMEDMRKACKTLAGKLEGW